MADLELTILSNNPDVEATDFIYTEKNGVPPSTLKTSVSELQQKYGALFIASDSFSLDNQIAVFDSLDGGIIKSSGATCTPAGNVICENLVAENVDLAGTAFLSGDPTLPLHAATKQYVDAQDPAKTIFPTFSGYKVFQQTIPYGIPVVMGIDAITIDNTSSIFYPGFKSPITAYYRITAIAHINFQSLLPLKFQARVYLAKNGVEFGAAVVNVKQDFSSALSERGQIPVTINRTVHLNGGDVVSVWFVWDNQGFDIPALTYMGGNLNSLMITPIVAVGAPYI